MGRDATMRILMTMFGWAETGGGTIFPRQIAQDLVQRGHDVFVVSAALQPLPLGKAYATRDFAEGGVRVRAIHNRPTAFLDAAAPVREVHDAAPIALVDAAVREFRPDVVHFHNFLGLSAGITGPVAAAGIPSCASLHNFWAVCPTLYLQLPGLTVCAGVDAAGANCLQCTHAEVPGSQYVARRDRIREALVRDIRFALPASSAVRDTLLQSGYPAAWLRLLPLGNARAERIRRELGKGRRPGVRSPLRFGFLGSVLPIKGVHLLVGAAQALRGAFEVHVYGDGPTEYLDALRQIDRKQLVRFHGGFDGDSLAAVIAGIDVGVVPSVCIDHSPLVIGEMQAGGVPVLGARIGGIPDYVQPDAGALFAANDMAALAIAMQRLLDAPDQVVAWQQRLRPPASWAGYIDALVAIYHELQGSGRVGGRPGSTP